MLTLLYEALSSPLGIAVSCSDPERARMQMYAARKKSGDVALDALSICIPPFSSTELWILKK